MSFLRLYFFGFVAVQMVGSALTMAQGPVSRETGEGADKLLAVLPERQIPQLDALLKDALEKAPAILIRRWEADQAVESARIARALMLPTARASASGGVIVEHRDAGGAQSDRSLSAVLYNVSVYQPTFRWGEYAKNYQVSKLARAIAARNVNETRRLLAVDLRRRYFDIVLATGSVNFTRKNLTELDRQLVFAKKQVEEGFAASTASALIDGQITATKLSLQRLENDRDILVRNLSRITDVTLEKLPPAVVELPKPAGIDAIVKALSAESGDMMSTRLRNAEDAVRMEHLRYQMEKTRLLPKFGVSFGMGQDNRNPDNNALGPKTLVTAWSAFATVDWLLFDGFSAQAYQRASLARLRVSEEDRDQVARLEADERRADVARVQLSWRQLEQAEVAYSNAVGAITVLEKDVAAGWTPASEVELARQSANSALQSVNAARADFYTTLATYFSNRGLDPATQIVAGR